MYELSAEFPYDLLDWQSQAYRIWLAKGENVLVVATPGAGKTILAAWVAYREILDESAKKIIVVVPSDELVYQWKGTMASVGINLDPDYIANIDLADDYHGIITTYQAVSARKDGHKAFRRFTSRYRTLAILDELHHVGESLKWSYGIRNTCDPCYRRLVLTGTAFRSDRNEIPYINYKANDDGSLESIPDFDYGYGKALRDGVVRHVYFQTFDGEVSWFKDGDRIEATFEDELPGDLAAQRLTFAIHHEGDWLRKALADAHQKLMAIRQEDGKAGGLGITKDTYHAFHVANVVESITGRRPYVVTSNPEMNYPVGLTPTQIIDKYKQGTEPWIVAVKMISEGVDIKRLRVGVWATNIQTELFFRQVLGRIVRMDRDGVADQYSWQYIPKLQPLTDYAETIKAERIHCVDDLDSIQEEIERLEQEQDKELRRPQTRLEFGESDGQASDVIWDQYVVKRNQLDRTYSLAASANIVLNDHEAVKFSLLIEAQQAAAPTVNPEPAPAKAKAKVKTLDQRKREYRKRGGPIAARIRDLLEASNGGLDHQEINRWLNYAQGVKKIDECTLDQLEQRVKILMAWTEAFNNGRGNEFTPKRYLREHPG